MKNAIPIILLMLMNILPCVGFQQKFGKTIPVTMIAASLLTILSQFVFHTFRAVYILCSILAVAGIILLFVYKDRKKNLRLVFSTGFAAFLLISVFVTAVDYNHIFTGWDELQHWGKMVKEMVRLDDFYSVPESTLPFNKDYPPFISCFQLFWTLLAGGYTEMYVSSALHTFLFTLLIPPLLDEKKTKDPVGAMLMKPVLYGMAVLFFLMVTDIDHGLFLIYTDVFIAVLFVYSLRLVFTEEALQTPFGFAAFTLSLTALIASKQICLLFAAVCAAAYIITALLFIKDWKRKGIAVAKLAVMLVLPALFYFGWNSYIHSIGIEASISTDKPVTVSGLFGLIRGVGEETQVAVAQQVLETAKTEPHLNLPFTVNAYAVTMISAVLLIMHGVIFKKEKTIWKNIVFAAGIMLCGFIYLIVLVYVYVYSLESDMSAFGSLVRYFSTFTIFTMMFTLLVYLRSFLNFKNWRYLVCPLAAAVICFALYPNMFAEELPDRSGVNPNQKYKDVADYLQENVEQGSSVCIIFTSPYVNDYRMKVSYYAEGIYIKGNSKNIQGIDYTDNQELIDGMGERFSTADYVYIQDATGTFNWNCRQYVEKEEYVIGGLYKVTAEPKVYLELIGVNENNPDPKFWEE